MLLYTLKTKEARSKFVKSYLPNGWTKRRKVKRRKVKRRKYIEVMLIEKETILPENFAVKELRNRLSGDGFYLFPSEKGNLLTCDASIS